MTQRAAGPGGPFDDHHQLQGALIDAWEAALLAGTDRRVEAETLARLVDFSAVHFAAEEELMAARGYPAREAHAAAHDGLLAEVRELERQAAVADRAAQLAAVHRLRRWLLDHVEGMDRALQGWLAAHPAGP
jgi:hemerythrin